MANQYKEFVEQNLRTKKLRLEQLDIQQQVDVAVYNAKRDLLMNDINAHESYLDKLKK